MSACKEELESLLAMADTFSNLVEGEEEVSLDDKPDFQTLK